MTIRHLKIFVEVVDCGKMKKAADKMFISQPTVSQAIKEIEEYYNIILFERLCKKLHITPDGEKLLVYARKVIKEYENLETNMFSVKKVENIFIGATITVGNCILSDIFLNIKNNCPNIEPHAYINNTLSVEEKLLKSELDIALVEGKITNKNLICIPTIDDYLVLACNQTHPFYTKEDICTSDLKNMDFVMREKGSGTRQLFEQYLLEHNIQIINKWETTSPESMKNAIINHNCLGVLSIRLLENEIKNGIIKVIDTPDFKWRRNFSIVYHKDKIINNSMNKIIDIINTYKNIERSITTIITSLSLL